MERNVDSLVAPSNSTEDSHSDVVTMALNVESLTMTDTTELPDSPSPGVFTWDPEDPVYQTLSCGLTSHHSGYCAVKYEIFSTARTSDTAVRTVWNDEQESAAYPGSDSYQWDGKNDYGVDQPAGTYTYRISAFAPLVPVASGEGTFHEAAFTRSGYLTIGRGLDGTGQPIVDVEYDGYDDNGTPEDDSDDNQRYYIKSYTLTDSGNTNAAQGTIYLYDPDLEIVGSWSIAALTCRTHSTGDGRDADSNGIQHDVMVKVPVSSFDKGGTYRFVVSFLDDHAASYRDHQARKPLELNQTRKELPIEVFHISPNYSQQE